MKEKERKVDVGRIWGQVMARKRLAEITVGAGQRQCRLDSPGLGNLTIALPSAMHERQLMETAAALAWQKVGLCLCWAKSLA